MKRAWLCFTALLLIPAEISADDRCPIHLVDWSDRSGVTFVHTDTFTDLAVDQKLVLTQGIGQQAPGKGRRE